MQSKGADLGSVSGYGWMDKSPSKLKDYLERAVDLFPESIYKMPDAIAFTGSSGAAIAFPLAARYKLPLIMIRKDGDQCHGASLECNYHGRITNYIIVDDFICTGATIRRIIAKIAKGARRRNGYPPECIGIYQWNSYGENGTGSRRFGRNTYPLFAPKIDKDEYDPYQYDLDLWGEWD